MYRSKMFELINDEINFLIKTSKNTLELKKIEIKDFKVKFVFLDKVLNNVRIMIYEFDWFIIPKLIFKNDYLKPYTDKYFR